MLVPNSENLAEKQLFTDESMFLWPITLIWILTVCQSVITGDFHRKVLQCQSNNNEKHCPKHVDKTNHAKVTHTLILIIKSCVHCAALSSRPAC